MLAYIDAGTAAAIAAMATGGLAGAKVAAQSFISSKRSKGKKDSTDTTASSPAVHQEQPEPAPVS